jgi:peptide/nickel transport system substrate-binding protein
MKRVIPLLSFVITLLFFIFLAGCSSDPKQDATTQEDAAPKIVRSRLRAEPDKLSPILTVKGHALQVADLLFPMLVNFDPVTYKLEPILTKSRAEKQVITDGPHNGGVAYTYEIHEEAVWDDGKPVTGKDYLFTIKSVFNPNVKATAYQSSLSAVQDIQIDPSNPKRFTVYCNSPFRTEFVSGFYIYPEHIYDPESLMQKFELADLKNPDLTKKLQEDATIKKFADFFNAQGSPGTIIESCGPYKLVQWETGQNIILEKKKNWWGDKLVDKYPMLKTYPDEIIFSAIPDDMAAITAMKGGQIDVAGSINAGMFLEFKNSDAAQAFTFHVPESLKFNYMGLNTKRPQLADKKVRRALAHLVNVDELIKTTQSGMAQPITTPFPQYKEATYVDQSLPRIPFDVEKAKALLTEAGWTDSDKDGIADKIINGKKTPLKIKVVITDSEVSKNNLAIIKDGAIKAGVLIEADIVTPELLMGERLPKRDFDAFLLASGFDLDMMNPSQFWHTSSDTPSGQNRYGFGNSESDAIIDELRNTTDEARRKALYAQIQKIIYDEQPIILLNAPKERIIVSNKFKNAPVGLRSPGYTESLFH